jgi:hypothetical protein
LFANGHGGAVAHSPATHNSPSPHVPGSSSSFAGTHGHANVPASQGMHVLSSHNNPSPHVKSGEHVHASSPGMHAAAVVPPELPSSVDASVVASVVVEPPELVDSIGAIVVSPVLPPVDASVA